jgi:RNA polymerase subunit RPABC4/transcription elongation factor Spt4
MAVTEEGLEIERSYMLKMKEILSKKWDDIKEYIIIQSDSSTIAKNYIYGDIKVTKDGRSYNIEIKGSP